MPEITEVDCSFYLPGDRPKPRAVTNHDGSFSPTKKQQKPAPAPVAAETDDVPIEDLTDAVDESAKAQKTKKK